jgi:4-amino-4-deoxy-L-arabinose transferase-like glycosyltransferase
MPPGYTYIVYLFYFVNDLETRNYLILIFQILLSLLVVFVIYLLTKEIFNLTSALIAAAIAATLPEFIYTSCLPGTTIFSHLGIVIILLLLNRLKYPLNSKIYLVQIGLAFGILILFRSEVFLLLLLVLIYFWTKRQFKNTMIIALTSFIIIIPWGIRNILVFNEFIPLTTSAGVNFYRGHNPYAIGVWADEEIVEKLIQFKADPNFELQMNQIYLQKGFENIVEDPYRELKYVFIKLFHLWIFNPRDERTTSIYYIVPWFVILGLLLISLTYSINRLSHKYLYLFLLYFHIVVILFFCLPRYQTMMKIMIIPFASEGFRLLVNRIIKKNWT